MPPAIEAVPEGRDRLHPHQDLVEQQAVALEGSGDHRLLEVRVPHVDRGVGLDRRQTRAQDPVEELPEVTDVHLAVEL